MMEDSVVVAFWGRVLAGISHEGAFWDGGHVLDLDLGGSYTVV